MVEHRSHNLVALSLYRMKTGSRNAYSCIDWMLFFSLKCPYSGKSDPFGLYLNSNKAIALDKMYNVLLFIYEKHFLITPSYLLCFVI